MISLQNNEKRNKESNQKTRRRISFGPRRRRCDGEIFSRRFFFSLSRSPHRSSAIANPIFAVENYAMCFVSMLVSFPFQRRERFLDCHLHLTGFPLLLLLRSRFHRQREEFNNLIFGYHKRTIFLGIVTSSTAVTAFSPN